ncbi:MAG: hypothetical protein VW833_03720, partial [Candidatus Neomarinimicrobiota bacterium]
LSSRFERIIKFKQRRGKKIMHMSLFAIKRVKFLTVISFLFLLSCDDKEKDEVFSFVGTWEQTEYSNIDRNSGWVPYGGSLLSWEFKSDQTINFKLDATTWTVNYDYCSDEEILQTSSDSFSASCICENTSSPSIMSRKVKVIEENEITFTLCDNSQSVRLIRQD